MRRLRGRVLKQQLRVFVDKSLADPEDLPVVQKKGAKKAGAWRAWLDWLLGK
jgi:hypothetical protein